MPERDWLIRLQDMLDCARKIVTYTSGLDRRAFAANSVLVDAVVLNLMIIGEAASRVPEQVRVDLADLPWRQIRGMRNRLVHDYHALDFDIVWETTALDIPELIPLLERAIARQQSGPIRGNDA